ncbi:MAG TPA: alkaline phosphatase family protein [Gemmatimonadaceae bacterium]|nr:alkaline phosphatase family protein [Gemmatimonadaceae bacterium]
MKSSRAPFVAGLVFLSLACAASPPTPSAAQPSVQAAQPGGPPRLIVLITVDQMRADYLDKWAGQFTGGLARLTKNGAVFTNAFQDHANTETAPGHSTLLSGREPYRTGIVFNAEGVPDPGSPVIGGGGPGASPFRFKGSTLFDWLKYRDSHSRALSVSRKDRGAILPVGHAREAVFWYQSDGRFSTSSYYGDELPHWVHAFNERRIPQSYAGKAWTPLLQVAAYPEPDTVLFEDGGREPAFPHVVPSDSAAAAASLLAFPFLDDVTVQFALDGVNAMKLGAGRSTDLLAVSLSSTDAVGHRFGMSSRELHDQILRVDRAIGVLIDSLYKLRDSSTIVFALTADHGVTQMPELAEQNGDSPPPIRVDLSSVAADFQATLAKRMNTDSAIGYSDAMLMLNRSRLNRSHINADSLARAFADAAKHQPGVMRADLFKDLLTADTVKDVIARRWRHAIPPDWPVAVVVTLNHGSVWGTTPGVHGSPWDDDCHVPIVFYGPWIRPGRYAELARTVDIAPTFAQIAGVKPSEEIDGHALTSALLKN